MTDFANLVLGIDSRQVKQGVSDLDSLTAAGTRAEAATGSLGTGMKASAVQATAMAAQAQAAARAATGMATGFKASAAAAHVNTVAMRETLVVARELSRGNFSRIPGSLTLLAQGIGSQGGIKAFASSIGKTLGLVKTLQNAELAEEATSAAAAAQAVEGAAARAAAAVMAADTEMALAQAQVRVTEGTSAEAAAQVRLAEAHSAAAAAAAESAVAENALADAYARSDAAIAASSAETTTAATGLGAALGIVAVAAGLAFAGFEAFKMEVKDSGELDSYAEGLRLTSSEIEKAGGQVKYLADGTREVTGLTITFGDVVHGTFSALADAAGVSASQFRNYWREALMEVAQVGVSAAQVIAGSFAAVANIANNLKNVGLGFVSPGMALLPTAIANTKNPAQIGQDALNAFKKQFAATGNFFHQTLPGDILGAAKTRLQNLSDSNKPPKGPKPKTPRKESDHGLGQSMDELDAETKGQLALAQAYLVSDAAAMKAEADEKAQKLAIKDHADAAQLAALKEKELALAVANSAATGAKRVNQLRDETADRKTVNDMVAAGIIPASQANDQLQLETQLRPLVAAQSLAEGDAKKLLTQIIKDLTQAHADNVAQMSREKELSTLAANDNEIAKLRLEADLIGASNKERAVAIAQLEAEQQLKNMPGLSATEQAAFIQSARDKAAAGVLTPFQQWAQSVPQTAAAVNEALQGIETKGFDGLASAIAGVVTGTESLKQAFGDLARSVISDIIQMTIKMLIFRAITAAFGGGVPSLQATNPGGANYIPPFPSANGNIFSNGSVIAFANGGVVSGPTLFPMSGGRTGLMGEAGPEAIMPLTRDGRGRLGVRAANDPVELIIHTAPSPDAWAQVEQISTSSAVKVTVQAAPQIVKAAVKGTMLASSRPKLMGR